MKISSLATLSAASVLLFSGCEKAKKAAPQPPQVVVAPVSESETHASVDVIGQVKAYDRVKLIARVPGFLRQRNFKEGDFVKKGKLLFLIEQDQYTADVSAAKSGVMKAQAELKNAMIDYERQKSLYAKRAVSQRNFDNAACAKLQKEAMLLKANASYKLAALNLDYTEIKAPFDGMVGLSDYSVGNVVGYNMETLAEIVKLEPVRVQFNISEVDLLSMQMWSKKTGNHPNPNIKLTFQNGIQYKQTGKITFRDNKINPQTGTFLLQATFSNPNYLLLPGMYVKVTIESEKTFKAIMVPNTAIAQDIAGTFAMVVGKDNIVHRRSVKTADTRGTSIIITKGLKPGEMVVTQGFQKIRDKIKVNPTLRKEPVKKPEQVKPKPLQKSEKSKKTDGAAEKNAAKSKGTVKK